MSKLLKLIAKLMQGHSDKNIRFDDLRMLLLRLGFEERIKGSHHIFTHEAVEEIINLQPANAGAAKPYQVKQVREIVAHYQLLNLLDNDDNAN